MDVKKDEEEKQMEDYAKANPIEIIENLYDLQAIKHKGLNIYGFVFYTCQEEEISIKGTNQTYTNCVARTKTSDGLSIEVNSTCIMMVRIMKDTKNVYVSITNPKNQPVYIVSKIKLPSGKEKELKFNITKGDFTGETKTSIIKYDGNGINFSLVVTTIVISVFIFIIFLIIFILIICIIFYFVFKKNNSVNLKNEFEMDSKR